MSDESSMRDAVHEAARSIPVGPAPSRASPEAAASHTVTARPPRWRPLAAAAAVVLVLGLSFSVFRTESPSASPDVADGTTPPTTQTTSPGPMSGMPSRTAIAAYLTDNPGIPLMVFENLPPGYTWRGPSALATSGGEVSMRASIFTTTPVDDGPILTVCTERRPRQCPQGDERVQRKVGRTSVTISVTGAGADSRLRDVLQNAPLSPALSVGWLTS